MRSSLRSKLAAASAIALCLPATAFAQAFPARGAVVQGSAEIATAPRATNIEVQSRQAVINWTLDDVVYATAVFRNPQVNASAPFFAFAGRAGGSGVVPYSPSSPIFATGGVTNFLPNGSTATFTGTGEAAGGYTVLNRLLLPGAAAFNGTVQSFIGNAPGGNVWFYSPNGIIVGQDAAFRVGGLLLTTSDIDLSGGLFGANGEVRFRGAPGSLAAIELRPGARVEALGEDSYIALVAPRIVQAAALRADGSVALVAAEQADITINAGLIDIAVTQGTGDANGIVHMGSTDATRVSMVAVPKNQAIAMLLTGTVGYQGADQVAIDNGAIVLAAGASPGGGAAPGGGSILIGDSRFTAPLSAYASDAIEVAPAARGAAEFRGATSLAAGRAVRLTAVEGAGIAATTSLGLAAGEGGLVTLAALGGTAQGLAPGAIRVGSSLEIDTPGGDVALAVSGGGIIGASGIAARADGFGRGGGVTIRDDGGRLDFGSVSASARGYAGSGSSGPGEGTGGDIRLDILGQAQAWQDLSLDASGSLTGGRIALDIAGTGSLALIGDLAVAATGGAQPDGPGFRLQAAGKTLAIGGAASIDTAGDVQLALAPGGRLRTGEALSVTTRGAFTADGLLDVAADAAITADRGIAITALGTGGSMLLEAVDGPVAVSRDLRAGGPVTARGRSVDLLSTGPLRLAGIEASDGDANLRVAGDLRLSGPISATGALLLDAGGSVLVDASVAAASIAVLSHDIAIGAEGRLGARGITQSLSLTNRQAGAPLSVGGPGQSGGYALDAAELGRLFADRSIAVDAGAADLRLGDFSMDFGPNGNIGTGGMLSLRTTGDVEVGGAARIAASGASDTFSIEAGRIDLLPETGSIALAGADGALQGRLALAAGSIVAVAGDTREMLGTGAFPIAVNALLDRPAATPDEEGYLRAGQIDATVADRFLVQNSGADMTYGARRGFSANGLSIAAGAGALIVINGRTFAAGGAAITGLDTARAVLLNGAPAVQGGPFNPLSSINGCYIGRNCRVAPADLIPPRSNMDGPLDPRRNLDIVNGGVGSGGERRESLDRQDGISLLDRNDALTADDLAIPIEFQVLPYMLYFDRPDPARQEPLLDEPVTGVGNDDLWQPSCIAGDEDCPAR